MKNTHQNAANLSLKQLHYFVALADELHFTKAAARCFVTQSTLSGGIRELEQQLDITLFERDKKHVMLTPAGQALGPLAHQLLSAAGDFLQLGSELAQPLSGTLMLGAIPTIAPFWLPKLMREAVKRSLTYAYCCRRDRHTNCLRPLKPGAWMQRSSPHRWQPADWRVCRSLTKKCGSSLQKATPWHSNQAGNSRTLIPAA